jgi:hypothetical protein
VSGRGRVVLLLLWLIALGGCAGEGSGGKGGGGDDGGGNGKECVPPETPSVSYGQNVSPILVTRCAYAGCHISPTPPEGLNLEAGASYAAIVGVPSRQRPTADLVVPGDLDASYFWAKITTAQGIVGVVMPSGCPGVAPAGGCLTEMETAAIEQWIRECAQDN